MRLFAFLQPQQFVTSIYHIDVDRLWDMGMRAVITDLDNTLVEWNSPVATPKLVAWLQSLHDRGFSVCIVSNNDEARVEAFARPLSMPAIYRAKKPRRGAFLRALAMVDAQPRNAIMIGDQLFTDVWGGNRMGMYTILVRPVSGREHSGAGIVRLIERLVLWGTPRPGLGAEHFHFSDTEKREP